jgi:hypothetical protein
VDNGSHEETILERRERCRAEIDGATNGWGRSPPADVTATAGVTSNTSNRFEVDALSLLDSAARIRQLPPGQCKRHIRWHCGSAVYDTDTMQTTPMMLGRG